MPFLEQYEAAIRLSVFAGFLLLLATAEFALPRKRRTMGRGARWFTNMSLVVVNTLVLRIVMPVLAVGMAEMASQNGWGLLALVTLPVWIEILIAFVLLDLLIYAQHVAFHKIPLFWRFHMVHHADRDLDVTSGARFHPLESVVSMAYKLLCVALIGPSLAAVILFEVVLNASSMFHHSNLKLPLWLDKVLRGVIVTPDMHRVHHSIVHRETDSNYSFFLTIWDRLFQTYVAQPKSGHTDMTIGLADYQDERPANLVWTLVLPFKQPRDADKKTGGSS